MCLPRKHHTRLSLDNGLSTQVYEYCLHHCSDIIITYVKGSDQLTFLNVGQALLLCRQKTSGSRERQVISETGERLPALDQSKRATEGRRKMGGAKATP